MGLVYLFKTCLVAELRSAYKALDGCIRGSPIPWQVAYAGKNLFITGSSRTGKSFLATAIGYEACKKGIRTYYANAPKLMGMPKVAKVKCIH